MGTIGQSITLANSIIGVGILAMPFCFQQCGVLLATLILLLMGLVSRLCCHFLLKSALLSRRRNFEFLAFHVFGPAGKLAVEVGIIGFLMGTCIAYFVVVGDLGPQIIAKMFNINQSDILRTSIMVIVSLVCVLPLGLLRNVDSLNNVSAATIGFYFCLVIKLITEATSQLINGDWQTKVEMWKPTGVLQCVPIFSMALFCQTQLFEIFESLPTLSLEKMNLVTKNAINICTAVYFTLGLFGYIAFCTHNISGNILMSLAPTMANDVIRLGFVMSLAFSFPLIIFPCRASLYSFLYKKAHPPHHDHIINHSIPESTFRTITVCIIGVALCISLLIPNIELVLGLVGSTIGVLVCVVFPAACFVSVTFKNTNERVLAKAVVVLGLVIMVLGTFANLQAAEGQVDRYDDKITQDKIDKIVEAFFENMDKRDELKPMNKNKPREEGMKENDKNSVVQPPNPVPPESGQEVKQKTKLDEDKKNDEKLVQIENEVLDKVSESHPKNLQTKLNEAKNNEEKIKAKIEEKAQQNKVEPQPTPDKSQEKIDMIKQQQLIETIKQHGEEQKELIKEQKEILDEIIKTKKEIQQNKKEVHESEAKKIAVESIQKIANMAIQSLSGVSEKPREKESDKVKPIEKIANEAVQEIAKQAVEAIKEIKEKPQSAKANVVNVAGSPIVNPNAMPVTNNIPSVQNSEAAHNVPQSNLNNVAPVNPVIADVKQDNKAPIEYKPNALPLIQNENIVQNNNNLQMNNNNLALDSRPIVSQLANKAQAAQQPPSSGQPENVQEMPQKNNQINQQQQINHVNQIVEKPNVDSKINEKTPDTQVKSQNDEPPVQNNQINNKIETPKSHSHSPDEPQSYIQGEDTQKVQEAMKSMAQNVPIPIAMNGNAQNQPKIVEVENVIQSNNPKNDRNDVSNVQTNGAKNSPLSNIEAIPVRQKREVVDCTQSLDLSPQDQEICKSLVGSKIKIVESKTDEILPAKVDLGEIAFQKNLLVHHIRTLKSFDEVEKNR